MSMVFPSRPTFTSNRIPFNIYNTKTIVTNFLEKDNTLSIRNNRTRIILCLPPCCSSNSGKLFKPTILCEVSFLPSLFTYYYDYLLLQIVLELSILCLLLVISTNIRKRKYFIDRIMHIR